MATEGYWISPEGELIEVRDHFEEVRSRPQKFGFKKSEELKWKREDRERVLRDAILRDWIRVRGHGNYTTFEIPEFNQDTSFRMKDFLEKTGAWENEVVEVHELKAHKHWRENVEFFLGERHLALLGQTEKLGESDGISATGISAGLAEAVSNEGFLRGQDFRPTGTPEVIAVGQESEMGAETVRRIRTTTAAPALVASIAMGLESGFGKQETFDPRDVRAEVMKYFPSGGTAVMQYGWFTAVPEDSVRISIENSGTGMSDESFMEKMEEMVRNLVREFRQKSIWLDYYRGSERLEAISFDWKD